MRIRLLSMAVAAVLGLATGPAARAELDLQFQNLTGSQISFAGSGSSATFTFTTNGAGNSFQISQSDSPSGSAAGLDGNIAGSYTFSSITQVSATEQYAVVSTTNGQLVIQDGMGHSLTGSVQGVDIDSNSKSGSVNLTGQINLTNVMYSGSNADLNQLKTEANYNGGVLSVSFTLKNGQNLATLESTTGSPHQYTFSGSIETTSTPEPSSMALAGLGALGLIGYGLRRRKARTA